jgi:hypothetical protein
VLRERRERRALDADDSTDERINKDEQRKLAPVDAQPELRGDQRGQGLPSNVIERRPAVRAQSTPDGRAQGRRRISKDLVGTQFLPGVTLVNAQPWNRAVSSSAVTPMRFGRTAGRNP